MKKYSRKGLKERNDCRQTGNAYTTVSSKSVSSRKQIPLITGRLKCTERFKDENLAQIFTDYWNLGQ